MHPSSRTHSTSPVCQARHQPANFGMLFSLTSVYSDHDMAMSFSICCACPQGRQRLLWQQPQLQPHERTGQQTPKASIPMLDAPQIPHASTEPAEQQSPLPSRTGTTPSWPSQHSPMLLSMPDAQHVPLRSMRPGAAQNVVSTSQIAPPQGDMQTQASSSHLPWPLQFPFSTGSSQKPHGSHDSATSGCTPSQAVSVDAAASLYAFLQCIAQLQKHMISLCLC